MSGRGSCQDQGRRTGEILSPIQQFVVEVNHIRVMSRRVDALEKIGNVAHDDCELVPEDEEGSAGGL